MGTERALSHHIDQIARPIFEAAMVPWAVANRHGDDYAIDYTVEVLQADASGAQRVKGNDFQVQLKGTENLDRNEKRVRFDLDVVDLKHYLENKRLPIFLVVVDVPLKTGYWLFLQQYAADHLKSGWESQRTVTVHLPIVNALDRVDTLRAAVYEAHGWMQERWPGSPRAAIGAERARLEKIDPRFEIELLASEESTKVVAHPKEAVSLKLHAKGSQEAIQSLYRAIMLGEMIEPRKLGLELRVTGSPLLSQDTPLEFKAGREAQIVVAVVRSSCGARIELPTTFTIGTNGMRGVAKVGASLLQLDLSLRPGATGDWTTVSAEIECSMSFEDWVGRDILAGLPHYDRLARVFGDLTTDEGIEIELELDGTRLCAFALAQQFVQLIRSESPVEMVRRIRVICDGQVDNFVLPTSLTPMDMRNLARLWRLKQGLSCTETSSTFGGQVTIDQTTLRELEEKKGPLRIDVRKSWSLSVCGYNLNAGPVEIRAEVKDWKIENARPTSDSQRVNAYISAIGACSLDVMAVQTGQT